MNQTRLTDSPEQLNECFAVAAYNLKHTEMPNPLGLIINGRSAFVSHLAIGMELMEGRPDPAVEGSKYIQDLATSGQFQAAKEKAAAAVLEFIAAAESKGKIPIFYGIADRTTWETTLRKQAAEVDDYFRENLEKIVAEFRSLEATTKSKKHIIAIIEPGLIAYAIMPNERPIVTNGNKHGKKRKSGRPRGWDMKRKRWGWPPRS